MTVLVSTGWPSIASADLKTTDGLKPVRKFDIAGGRSHSSGSALRVLVTPFRLLTTAGLTDLNLLEGRRTPADQLSSTFKIDIQRFQHHNAGRDEREPAQEKSAL